MKTYKVTTEQKELLEQIDDWLEGMSYEQYGKLKKEFIDYAKLGPNDGVVWLHHTTKTVYKSDVYNEHEQVKLNFLREKYIECNDNV